MWVQSSWGTLLDDLLHDRFDIAIGGKIRLVHWLLVQSCCRQIMLATERESERLCDVAMTGISMTEERVRAANFSRPLLDDGKVLVYRCSESDRYEDLAAQLRVAVGEGEGLYGGTVAAATAAWRHRYAPRVAVNPGGTNERSVRSWFALRYEEKPLS